MKALVAALALLACLSTPLTAQRPEPWAIEGYVLSVVEKEGIIIRCVETEKFGMRKPAGGDIVFLRGNFPSAADNDPITTTGYPSGTYKYTSAGGAAKTVRAFSLRP